MKRSVSTAVLFLLFVLVQVNAQEKSPDRRFQQWDRNKDGKLTREELPPQTRRNFDRVDTNRDGFISLDEHLRFIGRGKQPTQADNRGRNVRVPSL